MTDSLAATLFSKIMGTEGTIDVASLQTLAQTTADVAPAIASAAQTVEALPAAHLDQVAGPLEKVRTMLDEFSQAATLAGNIAPALPSMLGRAAPPRPTSSSPSPMPRSAPRAAFPARAVLSR